MNKYKVVLPRKVEEVLENSRLVAGKHAADGASSILNSLQDYSWNLLAPTIATCLAAHRDAERLKRQVPKTYKERDRLLAPITLAVRATRDFLLGVFRATPARLGDWGFDVVLGSGRPRVEIPENVEQLLELARLIVEKHTADGASSVLNGMQDYSWTTLAPTIQTCRDKHLEAESLSSQEQEAYETRNLLLPPISNALKASRDLLLGAFPLTLTRLGDWGFVVVQVTRKPRPKPGSNP